MFIPKTQNWEVKDGSKKYQIALSAPAFIGGTMKFTVDEKEYLLKPLKAVSFGFAREEAFELGEKKGVLKVASNGDAQLFINDKEIAQKA